jgi:tripartite-type tricarboxylate transporter receptor subunit TctC
MMPKPRAVTLKLAIQPWYLQWLFVFLTAVLAAPACNAQTYPQRPIRIVVGFSAGGPADILSRIVGQRLTESLGQQVVIDNRPGAGGNIAGELVSKASADGYTVYMANIGHAVNASLYGSVPFDPVKQFAPIALITTQPSLLVANLGFPAKSVSELLVLAKARPGQINYATAGNGTGSHLSGELLKMMTGIDIVHVPYKGSPPAINDLLGGHVPLMIDGLPSALSHVRVGKSRALGITGAKRSPAAPEIATIAEQGVPGYEAYGWNGMLAPAGTPRAIIEKLNREIASMVELAEVNERLATLGFTPSVGSPEDFRRFIESERTKWAKVIERAGVRLN